MALTFDERVQVDCALIARIDDYRRAVVRCTQRAGAASDDDFRARAVAHAHHFACAVRHSELAYYRMGGRTSEYVPAVYREPVAFVSSTVGGLA